MLTDRQANRHVIACLSFLGDNKNFSMYLLFKNQRNVIVFASSCSLKCSFHRRNRFISPSLSAAFPLPWFSVFTPTYHLVSSLISAARSFTLLCGPPTSHPDPPRPLTPLPLTRSVYQQMCRSATVALTNSAPNGQLWRIA